MKRQTHFLRNINFGKFSFFLPLVLSAGFFSCNSSFVYQPKIPDQASLVVSHLGTYSSKVDEEKELEGTIFQTSLSMTLIKSENGFMATRKLDSMLGRGYHKNSMPHELEKKVNLIYYMDSNLIPVQILGYDSLQSILSQIEQKDAYRKQLLLSSDTLFYQAQTRDWWRLATFLPIGQKLIVKQALPVEVLNVKLESFKVDSAHFTGPRIRMKKSCLDYNIYYHRIDSLPLLVEQFYFSSIPNRKFRKAVHKPAIVRGTLQFSVNRVTGLPCFYTKSEMADMLMEFKEDKVETPIHLYSYEEDIYD